MTFTAHPAIGKSNNEVPDDVLSVMSYAAMLRRELYRIAKTSNDPVSRAMAKDALAVPLKHI